MIRSLTQRSLANSPGLAARSDPEAISRSDRGSAITILPRVARSLQSVSGVR
jgi:hypothetical protein